MKIYLNGKLVDESRAKVSVFDHGLLYGDGVFEGIRAYNGRVFMLDEHLDRLYRSAQAIALTIPMTQAALSRAVVQTCKANGVRDGYIRLVVTRGVGTLGLNPFTCKTPQVIIIAGGIQLYPKKLYETGLSIITVGTMRNSAEAVNPRIKSLNYLNNILAKIEALNAGVMECIMLNPQGYVAEASGDNVFAVKGKTLLTPPPWCGSLEGITRETVLDLASRLGIDTCEKVLTIYDVHNAAEVFVTGSAAGIMPVGQVDRRAVPSGVPGPVTTQLIAAYEEEVARLGEPIDATS